MLIDWVFWTLRKLPQRKRLRGHRSPCAKGPEAPCVMGKPLVPSEVPWIGEHAAWLQP